MTVARSGQDRRKNLPPVSQQTVVEKEQRREGGRTIDEFGHRLFLLSLALSAVAICACSLFIPVLVAELDDLGELAEKEGKVFKEIGDGIWLDLMRLQGRPAWDKHSSRVVPLKRRPERELQMSPVEIKHFQDRLERRSFKGRQRLKQSPSAAIHLESEKVPRARAWSFAAQTYQEAEPIQSDKIAALSTILPTKALPKDRKGSNRFDGKCPQGPPGTPGLPGLDGVPGENGVTGKPGKSGVEVQKEYDNSGCIKCPAGMPGVPGPPGQPGVPGETGVPGVPGLARSPVPGPPGPIGEPGLDGVNGTDGVAGLPGVPGINGKKGQPGPKGEVGLPGEPGQPGEHGPNGESGAAGDGGWPGWPGGPGNEGAVGPIGPIGVEGIPGIEHHYCNCPVRTSQLMTLKDQPGGVDAYLGRWKGRLPNQLLDDYEKFIREKEVDLKIKPPLVEVQN